MRRLLSIPLIVAIGCATIPAPAHAATSTAAEVEQGKEIDKQILATYNVVTDPLLNSWVNGISTPLFAATARKDVPYSIKILDDPEINAFSTLGGFVYVDEGTLDFVQSDDELAGVIGHETGHIERRHALQAQSKFNVLNLLFGVGSIFSPFISQFGNILEAGAIAKIEREDETQADKYGLMLMTRTGYDPQAMVSFMRHLGAYTGEHDTLLDKYFADHPETPKRVAALVGYPELDPKVVTPAQYLAAAIHDQDEARYAIAARNFAAILATAPDNTIARYHLGEAQLALGAAGPGEQNLTLAAAAGSAETRALATQQIEALRASEQRMSLMHVDLQPLRDQLAAVTQLETQAAAAIITRRDSGREQLKTLQARETQIAYGMPAVGALGARTGSRLDTVLRNIATMSRGLDTANEKPALVFDRVGSAANNRYGGLLKENADILATLNADLGAEPLTPATLSALPAYPQMLAAVQAADADMVRAVDAARASLALLDLALGDLNGFIRSLQTSRLSHGDLLSADYATLEPLMDKTVASIGRAAVAASQAAQLYDMARASQLEARLDLVGVMTSPERYATLQHALDVRFHNGAVDYATMLRDNLTPGDAAAASIIAADTKSTPQAVLAQAAAEHRSLVEIANERGMQALALKIFLGLVYFDYTDDPEQEARVPA